MFDCTRLDSNKKAMLLKKVLEDDELVILDICNSQDFTCEQPMFQLHRECAIWFFAYDHNRISHNELMMVRREKTTTLPSKGNTKEKTPSTQHLQKKKHTQTKRTRTKQLAIGSQTEVAFLDAVVAAVVLLL